MIRKAHFSYFIIFGEVFCNAWKIIGNTDKGKVCYISRPSILPTNRPNGRATDQPSKKPVN